MADQQPQPVPPQPDTSPDEFFAQVAAQVLADAKATSDAIFANAKAASDELLAAAGKQRELLTQQTNDLLASFRSGKFYVQPPATEPTGQPTTTATAAATAAPT